MVICYSIELECPVRGTSVIVKTLTLHLRDSYTMIHVLEHLLQSGACFWHGFRAGGSFFATPSLSLRSVFRKEQDGNAHRSLGRSSSLPLKCFKFSSSTIINANCTGDGGIQSSCYTCVKHYPTAHRSERMSTCLARSHLELPVNPLQATSRETVA